MPVREAPIDLRHFKGQLGYSGSAAIDRLGSFCDALDDAIGAPCRPATTPTANDRSNTGRLDRHSHRKVHNVRKIAALLIAGAMSVAPAVSVAQDSVRTESVRFAPGTSRTTITDSVVGRGTVLYRLGAVAGQRMQVVLTSANTSAYFNVYAPGTGPGDQALAAGTLTGPMMPDLNRFEGILPQSGEYTISVYLYRNAAREGQSADYALDISITGDTGAVVQGDYADGLQGGPDYWAVNVNTTLNIRSAPSASAPTVARLPNGIIVENRGCRMAEGRRWCRVADGDATGWAAGDYLVEAARPSAPSGGAGGAGMPTEAEQACLRDVTVATNNPDVVLLGSEFSQAGTFVRVGVGPSRAPWKCIAYSDGTTAGIEFMGEG